MSAITSPLIQIIEDDKEFGSYLVELLEDEGYRNLQWIVNGLEGASAVLKEIPQLVILDLNLPGLRGEEICRLVRSSRLHQNTRILVCSDMPQAKQRELEMLRIGADRYVAKPFSEESFLADVERLLDIPPFAGKQDTPGSIPYLEQTRALEGVEPSTNDKPFDGALVTSKFEGFQLLNVIGGGAMGTVYRAFQERLDRMVALKVFLRDERHGEEELYRFKKEARLMANLEHQNIITVYDFGQTGYTYYIAMEYMAKGSVYDYLLQEEITLRFVGQFIEEVFSALQYLHDRGILHRDIKPGNILISRQGTLKLGDFGISSHFDMQDQTQETSGEFILGTRPYMAPELLDGEKPTPFTDQFALGRTLLRLFEGDQILRTITPLSVLRPDLPLSLSTALSRCLSPVPEERYSSVAEAKSALLRSIGKE